MKSLFVCLLAFCSATCLLAQSPTFSPVGAKWGFRYQSAFSFGDFQKEAVSDTIIGGRVCRKLNTIERNYICTQSCTIGRQIQHTAFVAQSQDSIFLYNAPQNNFIFLFHFHAQVNDSLITDQKKYVCTRVGDTLLGGVRLKKWEFRQICPQFVNTGNFILLEKVGALNSDWGLPNGCSVDGVYHTLCFFREDNILVQSNNCISNIIENDFSNNTTIFPNPAYFNLTIKTIHNFDIVQIFNTNGQLVLQKPFQMGQSIDIVGLPKGFYFLYLLDNEGVRTIKRFVKN